MVSIDKERIVPVARSSPRRARELLVDPRCRPRRALQRDLRGPGPALRARGRPRGGRRAVHGDLEPGVHAGSGRRRRTIVATFPRKNIDTGARRARGGRAPGVGGFFETDLFRPSSSRWSLVGQAARRGPPRRHLAEGDRRARPRDRVPDRRRGAARQKGRGYILRRMLRRAIRTRGGWGSSTRSCRRSLRAWSRGSATRTPSSGRTRPSSRRSSPQRRSGSRRPFARAWCCSARRVAGPAAGSCPATMPSS